MGWCQEFGLQIASGCDHAMVAGHDACSCPDCATVCTGRFAGCPIVWGGAPVPVEIPVEVPSPPVPVPVPVPVKVPLALGTGHGEQLPRPTNGKSAATAPPRHNGTATGSAEEDLHQMCADLKFEVRRLSRTVDRLADAGQRSDRQAVLREVDARFEWLTNELSDRLVVLGNEIMAIKRHLGADAVSRVEG